SDEFRVTSDELGGSDEFRVTSDELGRAGGGGSGVVGGSSVGYAKIITFDMGGTSTDVALCPGRVPMTTEGEIAGLPLRLPIVDIHTVGAGGGSLAWVEAGGALLVGPQSAGASPGPAAYHAGYPAWRAALDRHFAPGRATVSDANLVLGRLDAAHFLGGQMPLHEESARQALATLAAVMGAASPEAAAWAVIRVANANMERAVRRISVERGHDPRRFTLVAFGGGGPLHACELAAGLRIPRVLVPPTPGVLSALGMLVAEPARDFSRTVMLAPDDAERLAAEFALLEAAAREEMAAEGYPVGSLRMRRALDMRYLGQSHELTIPLPGTDPAAVAEAFHAAHERRYGYARPEATVEIVTARLTAAVATTAPAFPRAPLAGPDPTAALIGHKPVWFDDAFRNTPLYDRERLRPGNVLPGPGVVIQYDTTTIIPPGWSATVDGSNNLVIMSMETQQE
ncbi:MAG: hydantoinase/oxoprolinase family protein, partial [Anaerolineae bacterium]|nr:hydantoinase/oxoprolinase family protein [Anaerolineae bacterium]